MSKSKNKSSCGVSYRASPITNATAAIMNIFKNEETNVEELFCKMEKQEDKILEGDTKHLERMLLNQAQTLQSLFYYASERITRVEILSHFQAFYDLAFKANNACRKTILAIQQIKNPTPTTFIKQQNNAVNQQINNAAEAKKSKNLTNELLTIEEQSHETLDFRRKTTSSTVNPELATVEAGRSED